MPRLIAKDLRVIDRSIKARQLIGRCEVSHARSDVRLDDFNNVAQRERGQLAAHQPLNLQGTIISISGDNSRNRAAAQTLILPFLVLFFDSLALAIRHVHGDSDSHEPSVTSDGEGRRPYFDKLVLSPGAVLLPFEYVADGEANSYVGIVARDLFDNASDILRDFSHVSRAIECVEGIAYDESRALFINDSQFELVEDVAKEPFITFDRLELDLPFH